MNVNFHTSPQKACVENHLGKPIVSQGYINSFDANTEQSRKHKNLKSSSQS